MDKIVWTDPALEDLQDIHRYVRRDSVGYADRLANRLMDEIDDVATFPRSGRVVGTVNGEPVRRALCGNYVVVYACRPGACVILGIAHGQRDLKQWLEERGERFTRETGPDAG